MYIHCQLRSLAEWTNEKNDDDYNNKHLKLKSNGKTRFFLFRLVFPASISPLPPFRRNILLYFIIKFASAVVVAAIRFLNAATFISWLYTFRSLILYLSPALLFVYYLSFLWLPHTPLSLFLTLSLFWGRWERAAAAACGMVAVWQWRQIKLESFDYWFICCWILFFFFFALLSIFPLIHRKYTAFLAWIHKARHV